MVEEGDACCCGAVHRPLRRRVLTSPHPIGRRPVRGLLVRYRRAVGLAVGVEGTRRGGAHRRPRPDHQPARHAAARRDAARSGDAAGAGVLLEPRIRVPGRGGAVRVAVPRARPDDRRDGGGRERAGTPARLPRFVQRTDGRAQGGGRCVRKVVEADSAGHQSRTRGGAPARCATAPPAAR